MKPARRKPKLPHFLSFPIGFDAIRISLETSPIFDEVSLVFSEHPGLSAVEFQQAIEACRPTVIMSGSFVRWDRKPSIGNESWLQEYLQGVWSLRIYPVARHRRAVAKGALIAEGLPMIANWFSQKRVPSWYWGRKYCDIVFLPEKGTVRIDTHEKGI